MSRDRLFVITVLLCLLCGLSYLNGRAAGRTLQQAKGSEVHAAYELAIVTFIAGSMHADGRWNSMLDEMRSENGFPPSTDEEKWGFLHLPTMYDVAVKTPWEVGPLRRFEVRPCLDPGCSSPYTAPELNALERAAQRWEVTMGDDARILQKYRSAGKIDPDDADVGWATYDIGPAETYNSAACDYNKMRGNQHALPLIYHGPSWLVADSN